MSKRVLDVLAEDREEQHVAEDVVPAAVQEHRGEPAQAPGLGGVAGALYRARVKGRVVHGRPEMWELVEDPDREVRNDQRDVDERKASRGDAIGQGDHWCLVSPGNLSANDLTSRVSWRICLESLSSSSFC